MELLLDGAYSKSVISDFIQIRRESHRHTCIDQAASPESNSVYILIVFRADSKSLNGVKSI